MSKKEYPLDQRGYLLHLSDLKSSYIETRSYWQGVRNDLTAELQEKTEVPLEEIHKKKFKKERQRLREECADLYDERKIVGSIITDLNIVIQWLEKGRNPYSNRGVERLAAYQREVSYDPQIMERYLRPTNSRSSTTLTEDEKDRLRDALEILSPREREVYGMAKGEMFPHSYIAEMLGISKSSVDTMVSRAHEKVLRGWQGTLF